MLIKVKAKAAYGVVRYYPDNTEAAILATIAKTETLTRDVLALAKHMGATIEVDPQGNEGTEI